MNSDKTQSSHWPVTKVKSIRLVIPYKTPWIIAAINGLVRNTHQKWSSALAQDGFICGTPGVAWKLGAKHLYAVFRSLQNAEHIDANTKFGIFRR